MEKIIITSFLLLLFCSSYSQQKESKIAMFPISENYEVENDCEIINFYYYPPFDLYICFREKNVHTSFIQDTLIVVLELKIRLYFTDSSACFSIENIHKLTPEEITNDKENEKEYINNVVFQIMRNSKFYYRGRKDELEEKSYYINMPFRFIPL